MTDDHGQHSDSPVEMDRVDWLRIMANRVGGTPAERFEDLAPELFDELEDALKRVTAELEVLTQQALADRTPWPRGSRRTRG